MKTTQKYWSLEEIITLYEQPFLDLIYQAQTVHRQFHPKNEIQLSSLLSIKTGGCPEDCAYCPQSAHHKTQVKKEKLVSVYEAVKAAKTAKEAGATRFCMGAAWRNPRDEQLEAVIEIIQAIKALGMETCVTLGMLTQAQAHKLKASGLDYYNHNLDTSPEFYGQIITTRTYQDRLNTLEHIREAGIHICCGGILGMGETRRARAGLIQQLCNLKPYPESVPINQLVKVKGTPLENVENLDPFEFIRTIAVARITMPKAKIRLSAGREQMSESTQTLCFVAGANSVFYGEKLLTTNNPQLEKDQNFFKKLGLYAQIL